MGSFRIDCEKVKRNLHRNVQHITQPTTFGEVFHPGFMERNTDSRSIEEFFAKSGFPASSKEEFEAIPATQLDAYVARSTRFSTWKQMMTAAGQELVHWRARKK